MATAIGRVYAIRRSDDFTYRYVGQTRLTLAQRMTKHRAVARSGRLTPFYSWLRKHYSEEITIEELEIIRTPNEDIGEAERFWIGLLESSGMPLLNISRGGIGPSGLVWTTEQREAARRRSLGRPGTPRFGPDNPFYGRTHSADQKKKWSALRKGKGSGPDNPNFGKFGPDHPAFGSSRSESTRQILSEQKRGARNPNYGETTSAETRAKMSAAQAGVPKPSSVRSAHTRHHTNKQIWKPSCRHCSQHQPPEGFEVKP